MGQYGKGSCSLTVIVVAITIAGGRPNTSTGDVHGLRRHIEETAQPIEPGSS